MAAFTLFFFAGEQAVAATAIDRALTLNPNSAHAWIARGYVYCSIGQSGPAIEAFERAMRLSPLDRLRRGFTAGIAIAHLAAGRYEVALDWAEQTLREEPGYTSALRTKVVACAHLDRIEEAREALREWIGSQPGLTIAKFKMRVFLPEIMAMYVTGLRKAGLPEE
jgi:adenylate cyclase